MEGHGCRHTDSQEAFAVGRGPGRGGGNGGLSEGSSSGHHEMIIKVRVMCEWQRQKDSLGYEKRGN